MTGLLSDDLTERVAAIAAVRARGTATPEDVAGLVACLGDAHKPVQRRAADALVVLQQGGAIVVPEVRAALSADTLAHRWGAAYALGQLGAADGASVPVLLDVLASDDGDRRWAAAQMLVGLADHPAVLAGLVSGLEAPAAIARKMALYCLRDLGRRWDGSDAALVIALDDPDPAVRLASLSAATVLAVDRPRLAEAASRLLADSDLGVSRAAAPALGKLGVRSPRIEAALHAAIAGPDPARARAATAALERLGYTPGAVGSAPPRRT